MRKAVGIAVSLPLASALALWALGVVGPTFQVSAAGSQGRHTSDIRMCPGDPNRLLVASGSSSGSQIQYRTLDGGATWNESVLPLFSGDAFQDGPSVDWTLDGKAWTTTLGINSTGTALRGRAYVSLD